MAEPNNENPQSEGTPKKLPKIRSTLAWYGTKIAILVLSMGVTLLITLAVIFFIQESWVVRTMTLILGGLALWGVYLLLTKGGWKRIPQKHLGVESNFGERNPNFVLHEGDWLGFAWQSIDFVSTRVREQEIVDTTCMSSDNDEIIFGSIELATIVEDAMLYLDLEPSEPSKNPDNDESLDIRRATAAKLVRNLVTRAIALCAPEFDGKFIVKNSEEFLAKVREKLAENDWLKKDDTASLEELGIRIVSLGSNKVTRQNKEVQEIVYAKRLIEQATKELTEQLGGPPSEEQLNKRIEYYLIASNQIAKTIRQIDINGDPNSVFISDDDRSGGGPSAYIGTKSKQQGSKRGGKRP